MRSTRTGQNNVMTCHQLASQSVNAGDRLKSQISIGRYDTDYGLTFVFPAKRIVMFLRPVFCLLVSAVLLTTAFSSESSAQWRRSGLQGQKRPLRVLGHGYSGGYHWRNPGPNSDYYNPYSAHNSLLMSHQEAGGSQQGVFGYFPNYGGDRYSPTGEPNFETLPGNPIPGEFIPANPTDQSDNPAADSEATSDDGASYQPSINSFQPQSNPGTNDFVPAGHLKTRQPIQDSDWSMQDPFASPDGR